MVAQSGFVFSGAVLDQNPPRHWSVRFRHGAQVHLGRCGLSLHCPHRIPRGFLSRGTSLRSRVFPAAVAVRFPGNRHRCTRASSATHTPCSVSGKASPSESTANRKHGLLFPTITCVSSPAVLFWPLGLAGSAKNCLWFFCGVGRGTKPPQLGGRASGNVNSRIAIKKTIQIYISSCLLLSANIFTLLPVVSCKNQKKNRRISPPRSFWRQGEQRVRESFLAQTRSDCNLFVGDQILCWTKLPAHATGHSLGVMFLKVSPCVFAEKENNLEEKNFRTQHKSGFRFYWKRAE